MFNNVIVGVDGRQGGRDAIALARQLRRPHGTVALAHVYGTLGARGAALAAPFEREAAHDLLERESALAGTNTRLLTRCGGIVGHALHELAEEEQADLLVVGCTRHAVLGRVLMGDDCRGALNGAPCAVAIAPGGYAYLRRSLAHIGVGHDGSPEGQLALAAARQLAEAHGAAMSAAQVLEGEELVQFGKDLDLLIVSSRGYGPFGRLVHGSVSRYLQRHATCPLLVLPRGITSTVQRPTTARDDSAAPVAAG